MKRIQSLIMGRYLTPALALGAIAALSGTAQAQFFTPGNLVVSRVGDGSAALTNAATSVFLDQYSTAGVAGASLPLPTAVSGSNRRVTNSGTATSEGALTLSSDGSYLMYGGYDAAAGTASVATSSSATVARVAARIDSAGTVNSSTALNVFSGNNIRSVASADGTNIYLGGATTPGIAYTTLGSTGTSFTGIDSAAPTNIRVTNIYNGQLYASTGSGTAGIYLIGSGLPTSPVAPTLLFATGTGTSPYDFFFASSTTVYVADDGTTAGLSKWTFSGGTWTKAGYTSGAGVRGLTGVTNAGVTTLYATSADGKSLLSLTDTGSAFTSLTLATAGANTLFRGVDFAPSAPGSSTPAPSALLTLLIGAPLVGAKLRARRKAAK